MDLLRETGHTTRCPWKGYSRYYAPRDVEEAAWTYPEPVAGMERLKGLVSFHFDALAEWLEEDEPVIGHPHDPFHRIDVNRSSRHVKGYARGRDAGGVRPPTRAVRDRVADTLVPPAQEVSMDLLQPSEMRTTCAYKILWTWARPESLPPSRRLGLQRLAR